MPARDAVRTGRRGRTLAVTRLLAAVLIPFLAIAFVLLYLVPGTTELLFAWTIAPSLSAMLLGSAYAGGIWFFIAVIRSRQWRTVRRGFPAVLTFATLALVATILHWDRFHFGHISFITWVILYITTPFLVIAAMWRQRGRDDGAATAGEYLVPGLQRVVLAAIGIVVTVTGIVLFIAPSLFLDAWAWQLTPLTARIVGTVLTLPGMVNLWMLVDSRWSAFRSIFQAELVSLGLILLALLLARGDLQWAHPITPFVVGGLVLSGIVFGSFYARCEVLAARGRRAAGPAGTIA